MLSIYESMSHESMSQHAFSVSSVLSVKVVSVMVLVSSVTNKIVPSSLHIDATLNITQGNCIFSRSW